MLQTRLSVSKNPKRPLLLACYPLEALWFHNITVFFSNTTGVVYVFKTHSNNNSYLWGGANIIITDLLSINLDLLVFADLKLIKMKELVDASVKAKKSFSTHVDKTE